MVITGIALACLFVAIVWTAAASVPIRRPAVQLSYLALMVAASVALVVWLVAGQRAPLALPLIIFGWGGAIALVRLVLLVIRSRTADR
ncbi:hypothetical protein [Micromonospora sp. KC213]|uniref:hypothetical protein n=1 Tax=Micromonospora sp. KC213 TaxID=2530378 RepID=UPI001048C188|nr:hypothetical protein [Micromonospora sp. KC213]TDC43605.1 hypothetical protein E1166_03170 [Micromonospora sp. KC213]